MNKKLQLLAAAAASLLATTAQAAVLTLAPSAISGHPDQTAGWGFSLTNDDAANYLLVTGTEFSLPPLSAFGSYLDLLGTRSDFVVLAPHATLTESYNAALGTGIGQFSFAASAESSLDGQVQLHYMLVSVDPNSPGFDPDVHVVSPDVTTFALASVTAVPEPSTWAMFGAAGLLAFARRRATRSPSA
ncbi:MAG: PEP-CTERM sorting domain-containing protein [Rubrivivax sp.]|nr:MAG: PEP-CTERM sorting domain-containing protein [Rubrivivax sp.]